MDSFIMMIVMMTPVRFLLYAIHCHLHMCPGYAALYCRFGCDLNTRYACRIHPVKEYFPAFFVKEFIQRCRQHVSGRSHLAVKVK